MNIFHYINLLLRDIEYPVIFEIGAHHCEDTLHIMHAAGNRPLRYFAFEPDPRNLEVIKEIGITDELVIVCPWAIGNSRGYIDLYQSSGNANGGEDWTGSSSIRPPKNHLEAHPWCQFKSVVQVPVNTLDNTFSTFSRIDHIDFIWADIQGAEGDMVKWGQEALKHTRYLYCEYSDAELYEGEMKLNDWMQLLPGKWSTIEKWPHDILLRNDSYGVS